MAVSHQGVFVQTPQTSPVSFTNGDGLTKKTLITGGANGTKVVAINAATTDTAAKVLQLYLTVSAVDYLISSVSIPASSGLDGTNAAVNMLTATMIPSLPVDNDGQRYVFLKDTTQSVRAAVTSTTTSGKQLDVIAIAGDF